MRLSSKWESANTIHYRKSDSEAISLVFPSTLTSCSSIRHGLASFAPDAFVIPRAGVLETNAIGFIISKLASRTCTVQMGFTDSPIFPGTFSAISSRSSEEEGFAFTKVYAQCEQGLEG